MNKVELVGRLLRDADLSATPDGEYWLRVTVVVDGIAHDGTSFVACEMWGEDAARVGDLELRKGDEVYVRGEITQEEVTTSKGKKERKTRVRGHRIRLLERAGGPLPEPPPEVYEEAEPNVLPVSPGPLF